MPDLVEFADDSVALAMKNIFSQSHIYDLDIADRLKQLLYEKKYDFSPTRHPCLAKFYY